MSSMEWQVSAVSMQSFLVGRDLNGCAFVYGSLSFLDKMLCGLALSVLESYQSKFPLVLGGVCEPYIMSWNHFFLKITSHGLNLFHMFLCRLYTRGEELS